MFKKNKEKDESTIIIARKVQLFPVGDKNEVSRVYSFLCDCISTQNRAMNQAMSSKYSSALLEATKEDRDLLSNMIGRTNKKFKNGKPNASIYGEDLSFPEEFSIPANVKQRVNKDFSNANKHNALLKGETSLPSYNKNNPFMILPDLLRPISNSKQKFGFYYEYQNFDEFLSHLYSDLDVFLKFPQDITFKCVFGNPRRSAELRNVFKNIFDGTYDVRGSTIGLKDKKNHSESQHQHTEENHCLG